MKLTGDNMHEHFDRIVRTADDIPFTEVSEVFVYSNKIIVFIKTPFKRLTRLLIGRRIRRF